MSVSVILSIKKMHAKFCINDQKLALVLIHFACAYAQDQNSHH